ncbi:MAG: methylmalonyl Co-A mutase-associated GTPase MeaB [Bacteroidales bacterium]|nr:methylmalonyl Co-A mutase-associated GTPase MeaB [Bacteroidales bacterium]
MNDDQSKDSALSVSGGVNQQPSVNPNLGKRKKKEISVPEYVDGILKGDRSTLGQAITLAESNLKEHRDKAQQIIEKCLPHAGNSIRIGITGVPGVGKSTFIDSLGMHLIQKGNKLAVLAIDPSSERSKGSILGDKTRMESLSVQQNAFIRPSSSAGTLGGVARKTRESVFLCEAAGFDVIFVETVGVGQSETAVHSMVDFFLLLMLAGAGDELQGIKRGIMEMADALVITKADGANTEKAKRAAAEYKSAMHLFPPSPSKWVPEVLTCSSVNNDGIKEIWDMILKYKKFTRQNGYLQNKRNDQSRYWMIETIEDQLKSNFYNNDLVKEKLLDLQNKVSEKKISSFKAAQEIIDFYFKNQF